MSIFEAALPEELAGPYRATLTRLQDAAPPMPASTVHEVLAAELGARWRHQFASLRRHPGRGRLDRPGAPGRLARRPRGRGQGAVPRRRRGAAAATSTRSAGWPGCSAGWIPGLDIKPIMDELKRPGRPRSSTTASRPSSQRAFAEAFARRPRLRDARRWCASAEHVLVSEWLEGVPLSPIIAEGTPERARRTPRSCYLEFLLAGPAAGRAAARRPAPRQLPAAAPTAAWASSTSARSTGCPTGCRRADGRLLDAGPATATPRACSPACARMGFVKPSIDDRRRAPCWTTSSPFVDPAAHRHLHLQPGLAAGAVRRTSTTRGGPQFAVALQAQPAAGVPADPPGLAGRDRRAVPDRGHGRRPGHDQRVDAARQAAAARDLRSSARGHGRRTAGSAPRARHAVTTVTTMPGPAWPRCCAGARGCRRRRSTPPDRAPCPGSRSAAPARSGPRATRPGARPVRPAVAPHVVHTRSCSAVPMGPSCLLRPRRALACCRGDAPTPRTGSLRRRHRPPRPCRPRPAAPHRPAAPAPLAAPRPGAVRGHERRPPRDGALPRPAHPAGVRRARRADAAPAAAGRLRAVGPGAAQLGGPDRLHRARTGRPGRRRSPRASRWAGASPRRRGARAMRPRPGAPPSVSASARPAWTRSCRSRCRPTPAPAP